MMVLTASATAAATVGLLLMHEAQANCPNCDAIMDILAALAEEAGFAEAHMTDVPLLLLLVLVLLLLLLLLLLLPNSGGRPAGSRLQHP
jgi:hypothetical protein